MGNLMFGEQGLEFPVKFFTLVREDFTGRSIPT